MPRPLQVNKTCSDDSYLSTLNDNHGNQELRITNCIEMMTFVMSVLNN